MTTINTYLIFNGNCEEAFTFYKSVFGGEFVTVSRYKDMPQDSNNKLSAEQGEKIMHVSLPISGETVLMGSDGGGDWAKKHSPGNNFSISISTDKRPEADRLFKSLSAGGAVVMPLEVTFWNSYFGMLTDKFGINWMISADGNTTK